MKRKPSVLRNPRFWFSLSVCEQIRAGLGAAPAETGGMIGGDTKRGIVTHYFQDATASSTSASYTPDANTVNRVLEQWNTDGVRLLGFPHSHPPGCQEPSAGDREYAARILAANPELKSLLVPIVMSAADGTEFSMRVFVARRSGDSVSIQRAQFLIFEDEPTPPPSPSILDASGKFASAYLRLPHLFGRLILIPTTVSTRRSRTGTDTRPITNESDAFQRVRAAYDLAHLSRASVACIGVGGAGLFTEHLARAGVGRFILIDPDRYSSPNLATQHCYADELGRPKVEAVAARIKRINPAVTVVTRQVHLDDLDDAALASLVWPPDGRPRQDASLLCGCTDSFGAQARVNRLSLNFGVPALLSQVYERGLAAELVWVHPALSHACARCILSGRYRAHQQGSVTPVTSSGAPIYSTLRLNAAEIFLALALLHHGTVHPHWGNLLARLGNRQLVQLRCHPDAEAGLGIQNFSQAFADANTAFLFSDEAVWRPQEREHPDTGYAQPCPDCGGKGDLRVLAGTIADTRIIPPQP